MHKRIARESYTPPRFAPLALEFRSTPVRMSPQVVRT
jgi:hypothetical protein